MEENSKFIDVLNDWINSNNFKNGEDFIKIDTPRYLILLPFNFDVLHYFSRYGGKCCLLIHCVTGERYYFRKYYDSQFLYYNRLKCFFFDKNIKLKEIPNPCVGYSKRIETLWEFTCWLDEKDEHTHLFHNYYNNFDYCEIDTKIYKKASKIIKNLRTIIFKELKKYDLEKIKEHYKKLK